MAESDVFDWVAGELEKRTHLSRLEARGTLRLVLKDAGLDPDTVAGFQMKVVLGRLMASALTRRRVQDAATLCQALTAELEASGLAKTHKTDTAYDVFERLDSSGAKRSKS